MIPTESPTAAMSEQSRRPGRHAAADAAARPGAPLSLVGLTKRYGEVTAVDDVSLEVEPGEFVTLLGPSGSGKTTTLNMIAGFAAPSGGRILMDGSSIDELPTHKRNIGVVFQHYALFPHLTVEQNVAYPLKRRRAGRMQRAGKVAEALEMVRLTEQRARYPRQLSGGQQQRVALARALVFRPRVLLMDEPLGALDKKLREWLQLEIKRLHETLGITFIYVTHDQDEALVLSDRIAVFNEGRIEQVGSATEMYEHPRTLFVAEFLGESNVFRGRARRRGGAWTLETDGPVLRAPAPVGVEDGSPAALVVRPERMRLLEQGSAARDHENVVSGHVEQVIYLGSARKVSVRLQSGDVSVVRESAAESRALHGGEEVGVAWAAEWSTLLRDQAVDLDHELERM
jgi:putative spermidine/putrescine transport system ATP-binding protein